MRQTYLSSGFSSTSIAFTRASYSGGKVSRIKYESLFTPTRSAGFKSSAGTRPITGKKMVCRVDVLITAHLPFRCESRSSDPPLVPSSSSGSTSSSCQKEGGKGWGGGQGRDDAIENHI